METFHFSRVTEKANFDEIIQNPGRKPDRNNYAGQWYPHILKLFTSVLRKGLGDRIYSLTPLSNKNLSWGIMETHPKIVKSITFGLKLNIENCLEVLVKGPQANHDDAESFKLFWGNKSELRRFQDGYDKSDLFHLIPSITT